MSGTTKLQVRPPTERDLEAVLRDLWDRGCEEVQTAGFSLPGLGPVLRPLLLRGWAVGIFSSVRPLAVCLWDFPEERVARTWFLASREAEQGTLGFTRAVFRAMRQAWDAFPAVERIEAHSLASHPDARRWFQALGFSPERSYTLSDREVTVFVRRSGGCDVLR